MAVIQMIRQLPATWISRRHDYGVCGADLNRPQAGTRWISAHGKSW